MRSVRFGLLGILFASSFQAAVSQSFTVTILSPTSGMNYTIGNTLVLQATASHGSTPISSLSFYRGGTTLIGNATLSGSVYVYSWTSVPSGNYSITAKATDNLSNTQTSSAVTISVDSLGILNTWQQGGNVFGAPGEFGTNDNNRIVFKTNKQEKATILPSGNFGLGTSNPQAQLHTTGSMLFGKFLNNSANDSVLSTDGSGNVIFRSNPQLTFDNGLTQNGNEVYNGGVYDYSEYYLGFQPPDENYDGFGSYDYGAIDYYGSSGYSALDMWAGSNYADTIQFGTEVDITANNYDLESSYYRYSDG